MFCAIPYVLCRNVMFCHSLYTIIVKNLGPLDANNVTLTDTLVADIPVAFKVIRSTPSPVTTNCDLDSDILITCILTFDSLNVNSSITTTILVTPSEEGTILNGVTVASDLPDPEPANNTPPALNTGPELDQSFLPIVFKQKAILTSLRAKIIYLPLLSKSNNK